MKFGKTSLGSASAEEARISVGVTVTFLRLTALPEQPARPLPPNTQVLRVASPTVPFYRYLYNTVGQVHLWWLRRITPDEEIAALLADTRIALHVLYQDGAPAGFYELDWRRTPDVNLSYFGLLPHALGRGLGTPFLRHAVDTGFAGGARWITVNTCTADSPRALPGYRRMGFQPLREAREHWEIPLRLGLPIPLHLRR